MGSSPVSLTRRPSAAVSSPGRLPQPLQHPLHQILPLHQQMPGLPEDLWDIVNRMIARTQAERPATMLEVRDLLVAFLAKHAG